MSNVSLAQFTTRTCKFCLLTHLSSREIRSLTSNDCARYDGRHADTNPAKVDMINKGQSPVVEDRIDDLIAAIAKDMNVIPKD